MNQAIISNDPFPQALRLRPLIVKIKHNICEMAQQCGLKRQPTNTRRSRCPNPSILGRVASHEMSDSLVSNCNDAHSKESSLVNTLKHAATTWTAIESARHAMSLNGGLRWPAVSGWSTEIIGDTYLELQLFVFVVTDLIGDHLPKILTDTLRSTGPLAEGPLRVVRKKFVDLCKSSFS